MRHTHNAFMVPVRYYITFISEVRLESQKFLVLKSRVTIRFASTISMGTETCTLFLRECAKEQNAFVK